MRIMRIGSFAAATTLLLSFHAVGLAAAESAINGDVRFSWWGDTDRNTRTHQIADMFEALHPSVNIVREPNVFDEHWQKLAIQVAAKNQPCAITMQDRYAARFIESGALLALDKLDPRDGLKIAEIPDSLINSGRGADGALYILPTGVYYIAMYVNESLLARTGLTLPEKWTWNEYAAFLLAAQKKLPKGYYAGDNNAWNPDAFHGWVAGRGERIANSDELGFSKQTLIDWFAYWRALQDAGAVRSAEQMVEAALEKNEDSTIARGRVIFDIRPGNAFASVKAPLLANTGDLLTMAALPAGPARAAQLVGINGLSIGASCRNLPATIAWINYFTYDPKAAAIYGSNNGVVSVTTLQAEQIASADVDEDTKFVLSYGQKLFASPDAYSEPLPSFYSELYPILRRAAEASAFGATPEEAAEQFFEEMQAAVKRASR